MRQQTGPKENRPGLIQFPSRSKNKNSHRSEDPVAVFILAAPARFERTTYRLGGGCSIQLSYGAFWNPRNARGSELQQAENLSLGQPLSPLQELQFSKETAFNYLGPQIFHQFHDGSHSAAGGQQVVCN